LAQGSSPKVRIIPLLVLHHLDHLIKVCLRMFTITLNEYIDCFETAAESELREKSHRDYRRLQTGKVKPKRTMSVSARRKIAAAQRARWAKVRAQKKAT